MITEIRQNLGFIALAGLVLFGLHLICKRAAGGRGLAK